MSTKEMIAAVESEITRLQLIRKLLAGETSGSNGSAPHAVRGSKIAGKVKRVMSAEARERIASAQRKRWALVKRAKKKAMKP